MMENICAGAMTVFVSLSSTICVDSSLACDDRAGGSRENGCMFFIVTTEWILDPNSIDVLSRWNPLSSNRGSELFLKTLCHCGCVDYVIFTEF